MGFQPNPGIRSHSAKRLCKAACMDNSARSTRKHWALGIIIFVSASVAAALIISTVYVSDAKGKASVAFENASVSQKTVADKSGLVTVAEGRVAEYAGYSDSDYVLPQEEQARKVLQEAKRALDEAQITAAADEVVLNIADIQVIKAETTRTLVFRISVGAIAVTAIVLGSMQWLLRRSREAH